MDGHPCQSQKKCRKNHWSRRVITCRPADLLADQYDQFAKEIAQYAKSEEDVLIYAYFQNKVVIS